MSTFNNITLEQLDALVKKQTAFASFSELIHAPGNYRPTLYVFRKANAIIARDVPFQRSEISAEDALQLFEKMGESFKVEIIRETLTLTEVQSAKVKGYEGDPCPECKQFTMVRNGTCLKCDTCGNTSGCS